MNTLQTSNPTVRVFVGKFSTVQIGIKGTTPAAAVKITEHRLTTGTQSNDDRAYPWLFKYEYEAKEIRPTAEPGN